MYVELSNVCFSKALSDPETEARVIDEIQIGDTYFSLNRDSDFAEPPKVRFR